MPAPNLKIIHFLNKIMVVKKTLWIGLTWLCVCNKSFSQLTLTKSDFTVLEVPADTMMRNYLYGIVDRQFAVRDSILSTLKTCKDWENRATVIKDSMQSWTGPLNKKTPLNAKITGTLERDGYTIEKVLFESQPGFFVSAENDQSRSKKFFKITFRPESES